MSSTMITKGLNSLSLNGSDKGPSDRDYIDHLNYEELERKFCVYKYYPQYIHNVDAPTPMIKDMISDKPIYAQANRHVKKKQRLEQRKEKRAQREEKREERKQERLEMRDLRQQQRQERHELRHELRHEQKNRTSQQQAYPHHITHPQQKNDKKDEKSKKDAQVVNNINVNVHVNRDDLTFRNPFGSKPPTFEESQQQAHAAAGAAGAAGHLRRSLLAGLSMRRSSTQSNNKRHNSIASKFVNILKGNSSGEETPSSNGDSELQLSSSYDATKSNMTSSRSKKTNLLKLKLDPRRRMSEQIGKYSFFRFPSPFLSVLGKNAFPRPACSWVRGRRAPAKALA